MRGRVQRVVSSIPFFTAVSTFCIPHSERAGYWKDSTYERDRLEVWGPENGRRDKSRGKAIA